MPNWLKPIERGRKPAPVRSTTPRDGRISFERGAERFAENHLSLKNGRPYIQTSRDNIRGKLLGGPLRLFRLRAGIRYIDESQRPRVHV